MEYFSYPSVQRPHHDPLLHSIYITGYAIQSFDKIAVTGGQYRNLPSMVENTAIIPVNEIHAIGRGGLALSGLTKALVVSSGSGTAMVAARLNEFQHVTGTAVGGGTLQGLCQAILGTSDPLEIDALARCGDANKVDLTLSETTGGAVGSLPSDANAVNFGRLAHQFQNPSREDLAAATVRLVAQVIAVIAINAAHAEQLGSILYIGRLVELSSVRQVLETVAGYYDSKFTFLENPGIGTVLGALRSLS